jgi:hypothetical protein
MPTLAELNATYENNRAARDYFETARWLALAKNKTSDAIMLARKAGAVSRVLAALQEKAGAGSTVTGSGEWGSQLTDLSLGFISSLSHSGAMDRALPFMVPMPLQTRIAVTVLRATGSAVDQGALKPVSEISLSAPSLIEQKALTVLVCSDELLRLGGPSALALLQTEMRSATAAATDEIFISTLIAALTPIPSGNDPLADLAAAGEAITTGDRSRLWVIMSPLNAVRTSFWRSSTGAQVFKDMTPMGGTISAGVTALVSESISDTELLMFDSQSIGANGGTVVLEGSGAANIDMGGGNVVSLFQTNKRAMLALRRFGFESLRGTDGAALINNVDYSVTAS